MTIIIIIKTIIIIIIIIKNHNTTTTNTHMPVRLERLIELINDAQRWSDSGHDYMPELGCSQCGKGCMPLCGLGLNRKVTPMEHKDIVLKTRKMKIETGKRVSPVTVQVIFFCFCFVCLFV